MTAICKEKDDDDGDGGTTGTVTKDSVSLVAHVRQIDLPPPSRPKKQDHRSWKMQLWHIGDDRGEDTSNGTTGGNGPLFRTATKTEQSTALVTLLTREVVHSIITDSISFGTVTAATTTKSAAAAATSTAATTTTTTKDNDDHNELTSILIELSLSAVDRGLVPTVTDAIVDRSSFLPIDRPRSTPPVARHPPPRFERRYSSPCSLWVIWYPGSSTAAAATAAHDGYRLSRARTVVIVPVPAMRRRR